ncbi:MAG: STAS domain-containing protein [Sedimentisphaerales bacterium]|nr:STAS domain-containing protein [Sedimentisphaerales bacterium]
MNLSVYQTGQSVIVIAPEGQFTLDGADQLKEAVCKAVSERCRAIVLDMSRVRFIDSQGLELLLWIRDYCQLSLVAFRLACLDEVCREILELTRLKDEFGSSQDLAGAIRSLV